MIYSHMVPPRYRLSKVLLTCMLFFFLGATAACNRVTEMGGILLPDIKPWDLQSIEITDRNNRELVFKRKMCVWTLGQEGLATNEAQVTELAAQIMDSSYLQKIPGNKVVYAKFMVAQDSFNYRVDLGLPEGETKTLFIGSNNASTGTHVRIAGDENIYVLSSKTPIKNIEMEKDYWLPISEGGR